MIPGGKAVVTELVVLSVIVTVVLMARIASKMIRYRDFQSISGRTTRLGTLRLFGSDDYIMIFNYGLFVAVIYSIWVQVIWGNNFVTAEDIVDWTPEDFQRAIKGSIFGIVMEICKVTCVWGCKACLLILYYSLTKGLYGSHKAVIIVSVYVAVGYFVVMICLLVVWCRPFHIYYDTIPVPAENEQCMTYRNHMILDACFNITGDAIMLFLPIPVLLKSTLPRGRKFALVGVFSLGGLVILCAILNRVTNFSAPIGSLVYLNWYAGEISTAMIVANLPLLWPLISRTLNLGSFAQKTSASGSQLPMQNIQQSSGFNRVGSEERITNNPQDLAYSENNDYMKGGKELSETKIYSGAGDNEAYASSTTSQIVKTIVVTQSSVHAL